MVLGTLGRGEVVVLLTASEHLVYVSPLGSGGDVLVVLVSCDERRRRNLVDNLGAGELCCRGAQVVQVTEDLPGAGGEQELPAVYLRLFGQVVPVGLG